MKRKIEETMGIRSAWLLTVPYGIVAAGWWLIGVVG